MAGNSIGGKRAAETNKLKYGPDFYRRIGAKSADSYLAIPPEDRPKRGFARMDSATLKAAAAKGGQAGKGKKKS